MIRLLSVAVAANVQFGLQSQVTQLESSSVCVLIYFLYSASSNFLWNTDFLQETCLYGLWACFDIRALYFSHPAQQAPTLVATLNCAVEALPSCERKWNQSQGCPVWWWKREAVLTSATANLLVQACSWGREDSTSGDEEIRRMICGLRTFKNYTLGSFCLSLDFFFFF